MRLQTIASALALAGSAVSFSDSTPFLLLSTSAFNNVPDSSKIHTSSSVLKFAKDVLESCPTDRYLLVTQPGVNAADLRRSNGCAMPHLCKAVEDPRLLGNFGVSEVVGQVDGTGLADYIQTACAQKSKTVTIDNMSLASVSREDRASELIENDATLARSLEAASSSNSYTILFLSTPAEPQYEADFRDAVRLDLKRHIPQSSIRRRDNQTDWDKLPLFEKYQFFTPGIFMAILTAIVLLSIVTVGLRALSSLEVSYGAFEKDMGPAAQKKQ